MAVHVEHAHHGKKNNACPEAKELRAVADNATQQGLVLGKTKHVSVNHLPSLIILEIYDWLAPSEGQWTRHLHQRPGHQLHRSSVQSPCSECVPITSGD